MPAKKTSADKPGTPDPSDDGLEEVSFEVALTELETLVQKMEAGELSLEESLAAFERGVKLTRHCQAALKAAELKVKVLTESGELTDLDLEELDDA